MKIFFTYFKKSIHSQYDAANEAIELIKSKKATCVTVNNNQIINAASPKGISYLLDLYDKGALEGVFIADTIIGKAAAMVLTLGGAKGCYGYTVSKSAAEWLKLHNIPLKYATVVPFIVNRKGNGMCPMEEAVKEINDPYEAIETLKNKVAELKKSTKMNK